MVEVLKDYCGCNPEAETPIKDVNYQEDSGAIVFEFEGESIYLEPAWIPVHYKSYKKFPKNYKKIKKVSWKSINPIKSKTMYTPGDYGYEKNKEKELIELEKMTPEEYNALPEYKKHIFKLEQRFN